MDNESGKKPVTHKKHVARLERERQQSRMILYVFIGILSAVVLLLVYGYLDINYFQLQKPVAKVGETEILAKDFQARVRLQRQQLLMQYSQYSQYAQVFGMDVTAQLQQIQSSLDSSEATGQTVLDQLINEELIRQEAAKRGIVVSEAELDEVMRSAFGYFHDGTPTTSVTPKNVALPDVPEEAFTIVTKTPVPSATPEFTATVETIASDSATTGTPAATATVVPSATPQPHLFPPAKSPSPLNQPPHRTLSKATKLKWIAPPKEWKNLVSR
ncbi:MAG: SurA N-terminal domain-containing protein [Anaerolineales bacterium]|uniref:SurA N-terminal domain-containing protein n=1 Tax=Candidatus Villigracilis proximus TaxID=3140683 RepID=UPI003134693E|nr:SurA N-terminal domain-containing protein [Anaerolineales bacterium]